MDDGHDCITIHHMISRMWRCWGRWEWDAANDYEDFGRDRVMYITEKEVNYADWNHLLRERGTYLRYEIESLANSSSCIPFPHQFAHLWVGPPAKFTRQYHWYEKFQRVILKKISSDKPRGVMVWMRVKWLFDGRGHDYLRRRRTRGKSMSCHWSHIYISRMIGVTWCALVRSKSLLSIQRRQGEQWTMRRWWPEGGDDGWLRNPAR